MSNAKGESPSDVIRARDVGGFDVWSLPSFDPFREAPEPEPEPVEELPVESEEVPLDEVQPLTLEELESIRQEAYNEGFATDTLELFEGVSVRRPTTRASPRAKKKGFTARSSRSARKPKWL